MADISKIKLPDGNSYNVKDSSAYVKPSGGIPKTDLASAVQTSLGKADTAIQSHQSLDSCVKTSGSQTVGGTKTFTSNMLIQSAATKGTAPSSNSNRYIRFIDSAGDYMALIQHTYTTGKLNQLSILTYDGTTKTGTNTAQTRLDFKTDGITCNNDIQASNGKWIYASNGSHYIGLWTPTSDKTDFMQLKSTHGINYMATQPHQFRNGDNSGWAQCKAASFTNQSSIRYKKNVEDITDDEAKKLLYLRPVSYDYKNEIDGVNCYGLIAEEVAEIETQPVCFDNDGRPDALDYSKFVPQLIKLCQVQQKEIDELKSQLNDIKKREG